MTIHRFISIFCILGAIGLSISLTVGDAELGATAYSARADKCPEKFETCEEAYRANNRGVAHLEQFNPADAAKEFRKALTIYPDLKIAQINLAIALLNSQEIDKAREAAEKALQVAPEIPHTYYVLGLIARNENRTEDALSAFKRVLAADPADVGSNVNVGQILTQERNYAEAVTYFRKAYEAEPYNSTAIYNLATTLIRLEQREEGQRLIERFQALRQSGAATSIGQNYLEQGRYAEALVSTGLEPELVGPEKWNVAFGSSDVGVNLSAGVITLFDYDNDGDMDLLHVGVDSRVRLFRNDSGRFSSVPSRSLASLRPIRATGAVTGDIDNDLYEDVIIFGSGQPLLLRGDGKGGFVNYGSGLPRISGNYATGALLDFDHDGDLDIFLGGAGSQRSPATQNELIRNNGDGTFSNVGVSAGIRTAKRPVAVIPTDYDNRRDVDLLVLNYSERPNLFQNMRDGTFRDVAPEVGLDRKAKWTGAAAGDINKDTYIDFFFTREDGPGVFAVSDGRGRFVLRDADPGTANATRAQFVDLDNDGLLDLAAATDNGLAISRNLGTRWSPVETAKIGDPPKRYRGLAAPVGLVSGDLDRDGDVDLLLSGSRGAHLLKNSGSETNRSVVVSLKGRVSNRAGIGSKIDIRSGSLSQKLESYSASPMPAPSDIHFGLGTREETDAIRVIWPSGVIQAEVDISGNRTFAKASAHISVEELDRKPSSCPYLYTWNGHSFEFVTDFLGGGEMGNWKEHGTYHFPDSDEFVRIPPGVLKATDGEYRLRVTNELEEVLFLDHLKLIAVEHPTGTEVYPNEGLGVPTAGKRIIYTTGGEHPPLSARSITGEDVLARVSELDRVFYDSFRSTNVRGYAEAHSLTLRLDDRTGYNGRTLLLLTGWTDYAFSSDNLAASQSGRSLFFPKLQVKDGSGTWRTVVENIGISVGRPQTVVVDLTGKFLSDSREVRIVTNFKTYWDKIAVDTSEQQQISTADLLPVRADLRERGFSRERSFGGMIVPTYVEVLNDGRWKNFSGRFTRTGDVRELLGGIDDVFVISKTGDELDLRFPALPDPRAGWTRTFLLFADGYSKEMDINSGSPDAVLPLPFKGMTSYPYGPGERFPMTTEKLRLYDEYTTRTASRALPPIEASLLK